MASRTDARRRIGRRRSPEQLRRSIGQTVFLIFLTAGGLLFLLWNGKKRVFGGVFSLEEIAGGMVLFYEGLVIYEITVYHVIR